jgi:hypothetical protein
VFNETNENTKLISGDVSPLDIQASVQDGKLKAPGIFQSGFTGFLEGLNTPQKFAFDLESSMLNVKRHNPYRDGMEYLNNAMKSPEVGWAQETANFVGNIFGFAANPINLVAGAGVGAAADVGISAISSVLPESISAFGQTSAATLLGEEAAKRLPEFIPKTIGGVGASLTKSLAISSAEMLPQAFNENFNEKTGKFNIIGGAEQTLKYGALGLGLHTIGMTVGAIYGEIGAVRSLRKIPKLGDGSKENLDEIDKAFQEGKINEDEYKWVHTYLTDPDNLHKQNELAAKILRSKKYNVDSVTNKVFMSIAKKDAIDNIHSSILDQLASNTTGDLKTAMSDYNFLNILDEMKDDSGHMVDGLMGHVSYMNDRLSLKSENLERFKIARESGGDEGAYKHITNDHPISQKSLFKELRKGKDDVRLFSGSVPELVGERLRQERKVKNLQSSHRLTRNKIKRGDPVSEKMLEKIQNIDRKIEEIKSNYAKLMNPSKELSYLEERLLGKDELPNNFQLSKDYNRLKDLSHFSEKAKALLHHVDLKNEYEVQDSYNKMIEAMTKLMDGDIEKYADPKKLQAYIQNSISKTAGDIPQIGEFKDRADNPDKYFRDKRAENDIDDMERQSSDNVKNDDELLQDNDKDIREADSKDLDKDNRETVNAYKQFKKNIPVMENVVSCVRG